MEIQGKGPAPPGHFLVSGTRQIAHSRSKSRPALAYDIGVDLVGIEEAPIEKSIRPEREARPAEPTGVAVLSAPSTFALRPGARRRAASGPRGTGRAYRSPSRSSRLALS